MTPIEGPTVADTQEWVTDPWMTRIGRSRIKLITPSISRNGEGWMPKHPEWNAEFQ